LRGERTDRPDQGILYRFGVPERERVAATDDAGTVATIRETTTRIEPSGRFDGLVKRWRNFEAPGTYAMVLFFLLWFVGFYVLSHLGLARLWPVG
jgi:hypothetical protein